MNNTPPRSPFATRLSGSAKETELRIRNIFQWKRQRPPLALLVLVLCAGLLCFNLVSCQAGRTGPSLVMDVQYYDTSENYIEIPALVMPGGAEPDAGVAAINQALAELKGEYTPLLSALAGGTASDLDGLVPFENRCLLYPSETGRYLSLVLFRSEYTTDLVSGHVASFVYDKREGRQVTLEDALALAGQTEEELFAQLSEQFDGALPEDPDIYAYIQDPVLEGFRMDGDGQPVFYLTARLDDDPARDWLSGSQNLYLWADGSFTLYDQYALEPEPLVPAEECVDLDPPLWRQWHVEGGQPAGGFTDPTAAASAWDALKDHADVSSLDDRDGLTYTMLAAIEGEGYTLAALSVQDFYPRYTLVIGAVDSQTGALLGPVFETGSYGSLPQCRAITRYDGTPALLYTANGMHLGHSWGNAGLVGCDGNGLTWAWPVEGNLLEDSSLYADYNSYWEGRLALLAPGGVDVFVQRTGTIEDVMNGQGHEWVPDHNETFRKTAEQNLPTGVYYQTRVWLEEFTRNDHNPWDAGNVSAAWQIVSLTPADGVYRGRNYEGEAVYDLVAMAANGADLYFTASLLYDHGGGQPIQVQSWATGTLAEIGSVGGGAEAGRLDESLYALLQDWYDSQYPDDRWYFVSDLPGAPQEGDLRMGPIHYEGGMRLNETIGEVYTVEMARYENGQFRTLPDPHTLVLSRSGQGGSLQGMLGALAHDTSGMTVEDIVLNVALGLLDAEVTLRRDGFPLPLGPGGWTELFRSVYDGEPEIQLLTGYEPIYGDGDYWDRWSVEGFSALRYYSASEDRWSANTIDVTRTDLYTPQGIRVGDSRAEVLEAYPQALTGDYWGQYPEEPDLLAYLPWSGHDPEQISDLSQLEFSQGLGPAILFFFDGDTVERIVLTVMDN